MSAAKIEMGSERSFGMVFAGAFAVVGLLPLWHHHPARWWALAIAVLFLLVALIRPAVLAPLNRLWFRFGLALGAVMTPVMMGLLFVVAVIPTALLMKLLRKDPMQRRLSREAGSYWERREAQPGPMREQY
ncbi:MAG: SxtJ family membrane protein [Novosphingobium sp.]